MAAVSSPCCRVCIVDPATGLCEGCGRTLAEISGWGSLSEAERLAIMAELDERMQQAFAPRIAAPEES